MKAGVWFSVDGGWGVLQAGICCSHARCLTERPTDRLDVRMLGKEDGCALSVGGWQRRVAWLSPDESGRRGVREVNTVAGDRFTPLFLKQIYYYVCF